MSSLPPDDASGPPCRNCRAPLPPAARVCSACGELVAPTAGSGSGPGAPGAPLADLRVGEVLEGTWQLEEIVGRGGMGTVFLATDAKLGRQVAVKALSVELANEEFVSRFEREARVLGILDHPNIVTLHWVGRHRGVPFIVMRFLDGVPLRAWVEAQGGRLSIPALLPVAQQICAALSYIHQKGVVHRDLKPSNIMVGPQGQVTVFDLGIARPQESNLTRTGIIFGTPGYMAPELIVGEKNLDGRLDLYALGVILFELCTGQPPFEDAREEGLLRAHLMKPRPDASVVCPEVPPAVGAVLQRVMALDPKDRYPDADEFLAALETAAGVRRFHEAATIRRTALSPAGSGARSALGALGTPAGSGAQGPDATPKLLAPPSGAAGWDVTPRLEALPRPGNETRPMRATPAAPQAPLTAPLEATPAPAPADPTRLTVPPAPPPGSGAPTLRTRSLEGVPAPRAKAALEAFEPFVAEAATTPEQQAPKLPPRAPRGSRPHGPALATGGALSHEELGDNGSADDEAFWKKPAVRVAGAVGAVALLVLFTVGLWVSREEAPSGPKPLPANVRGIPPPPPEKREPTPEEWALAAAEAKLRLPLPKDPTSTRRVDTQRIRKVRPHVRKQVSPFAGEKGYGELVLDVRVNGEPVAAAVKVDGEDFGFSPLFMQLRARAHRVRVAHPPFPVSLFTIPVQSGKSVRLQVELQPYDDAPSAPDVGQSFEEDRG